MSPSSMRCTSGPSSLTLRSLVFPRRSGPWLRREQPLEEVVHAVRVPPLLGVLVQHAPELPHRPPLPHQPRPDLPQHPDKNTFTPRPRDHALRQLHCMQGR
jgi:hypothetical protein